MLERAPIPEPAKLARFHCYCESGEIVLERPRRWTVSLGFLSGHLWVDTKPNDGWGFVFRLSNLWRRGDGAIFARL
jgi:hypothetical protein